MLSPPRIRETDLVIVRGEPRQVSLRGHSKPARFVESKPLPPRQSLRFGGMSAALFALLLLLLWSFWKWQKASAAAETANRDVEISWAFADKVLDDLQELRADAQRMDQDRKGLVQILQKSEKDRVVLRSELNGWREQHDELASRAQQVAGQWASYSEDLSRNLGNTRTQLVNVQENLQSERTTAQQQISALDQAKTAVEREADALNRKASSLENENRQMDSKIAHQGNSISSLQSDNSRLESCNGSLRSENSRLQCEVNRLVSCHSTLESRIRCLESELQQAHSASRNR